jgi:solute carrier family 13 (sodium-dependent dicarboxylate transporter), member 2/3/5
VTSRRQVRAIGLLSGPALFALLLAMPINLPSFQAKVVLAAAVWMGTWWMTEAIPIYATSLLPLALFPLFSVTSLSGLSSSYADRIIFLFLGGFVLAAAIERSGLHERFALQVIRVFGVRQKRVVGGFTMTTAVLSAWVSNTATTLMMLPIAASVVAQVQDNTSRARFGTCLMLSIAYSANIGGLATLIGTPPNAVFASLASSLAGVTVSFERWMLIGVPVSALMLSVTWWYLVNLGAR